MNEPMPSKERMNVGTVAIPPLGEKWESQGDRIAREAAERMNAASEALEAAAQSLRDAADVTRSLNERAAPLLERLEKSADVPSEKRGQ